MNQQQQRLAQIIQKIGIFKGLSSQEVQQLLRMCKLQNYDADQQIYVTGEQSTEMLILLQGQLTIVSGSGKPVGSVSAGTPIGEMGVFTGQPRSATVVASDKSAGVAIRKIDLDALLGRDPVIHVKILKNVVALLSERLMDANSLNEKHIETIHRMEEELEKAWKR